MSRLGPDASPGPDRRRGRPSAPIPRWSPATPYQSSRRRETGFSRRSTGPAASAFCSGVASNVARRSRTICQGGNSPCHARGLADILPDRLRQLLARHVDQPVAIADGDRQPLREREQPFDQPADDTEDRRRVRRRIKAEMRIHDGAEFVRRLQARQQRRRRPRRNGEHHGIVGRDGNDVVTEFQSADMIGGHARTRAARDRTERLRPCPATA